MNTLVFAALTIVTFVIPWEDSVVVPAVGSVVRLAGVIAAGAGAVAVLARGALRRPHTFHVLAAGFLLWSMLTLLWTLDLGTSQDRVVTYAQVLGMAWMIWEFAPTESRQRSLLQAYVLGACVPAIDTLRNYAAGSAWLRTRFSASGINPNEVAMVLVLGMPIAWYLALSARRRSVALLNFCYLPLAMLAMLLTASRGAFLASGVALLLIPWSLQRFSIRAQGGMVVLLLAFLVLIVMMVPQESRERLGGTAKSIEAGDFTDREVIWAAGLEVFSQHPVRGIGAGAFGRAVQPILGYQASPHQTFLSVLTGQGMVGLALFVSMFAAAIWTLPRMDGLQRKFWMVLVLTLFVGLLPRTWDYSKPLWFVLSLAAAQSALVGHRGSRLVVHHGSGLALGRDSTAAVKGRAQV